MDYGSQSMVSKLRRVIVRAPDQSFADADPEACRGRSCRPAALDAAAPCLETIRKGNDVEANDIKAYFSHIAANSHAIATPVRAHLRFSYTL